MYRKTTFLVYILIELCNYVAKHKTCVQQHKSSNMFTISDCFLKHQFPDYGTQNQIKLALNKVSNFCEKLQVIEQNFLLDQLYFGKNGLSKGFVNRLGLEVSMYPNY